MLMTKNNYQHVPSKLKVGLYLTILPLVETHCTFLFSGISNGSSYGYGQLQYNFYFYTTH